LARTVGVDVSAAAAAVTSSRAAANTTWFGVEHIGLRV